MEPSSLYWKVMDTLELSALQYLGIASFNRLPNWEWELSYVPRSNQALYISIFHCLVAAEKKVPETGSWALFVSMGRRSPPLNPIKFDGILPSFSRQVEGVSRFLIYILLPFLNIGDCLQFSLDGHNFPWTWDLPPVSEHIIKSNYNSTGIFAKLHQVSCIFERSKLWTRMLGLRQAETEES